MRHFQKKCEEFTICGSNGYANTLYAHGYPDNYAIYHIITKGIIKMGSAFEEEYVILNANKNKFVNVKDYLYTSRIYLSLETYHIYGFNPLKPEEDWNGGLIKESFDGDDKSWLICFEGNPIINDVLVKPMDYAKLENKHYDVTLNDAVVGIFTKL